MTAALAAPSFATRPRRRRAAAPPLGQVLGRIAPSPALAATVQAVGRAYWRQQKAAQFSDQVATQLPPRAAGGLGWVARAALTKLGLEVDGAHEWVMTTDVDEHVDHAWGLTLLWVLENGGLRFRQRGARAVVPAAGDWLIFDDRRRHGATAVGATDAEGDFLAWSVRLREIK